MVLSKNIIKYLRSLRLKKYRDLHKQFIAEGDKIVRDLITRQFREIDQIIATIKWLEKNPVSASGWSKEITVVSESVFNQISMLESPTGVMAVINMPEVRSGETNIAEGISLVLEDIQDPGNLGTIIRSASWFGIQMIYCSPGCADCFNPKVVQSSMGAVLYSRMCYTPLPELLEKNSQQKDVTIYGTFTSGNLLWDERPGKNVLIVFGNESRGISEMLLPYIKMRLHIPSHTQTGGETFTVPVESLNVASAVAIVCAAFCRPS